MKKTYLSPETDILMLHADQNILTGSANGTGVFDKEADNNLDVLSRRRSVWDDEDNDLDD